MRRKIFLESITIVMILTLSGVIFVSAQEKQDEPPIESREITSLDFQKKRPLKASSEGSNTPTGSSGGGGGNRTGNSPNNVGQKGIGTTSQVIKPKQKYTLVNRISPKKPKSSKSKPPADNKGGVTAGTGKAQTNYQTEEVGVTFWRLRPIKNGESGSVPTLPVKINESGAREHWTAERVNSRTKFKKGDRVRLTIESPRDGHLYIVNREFYTDGTTSDAALIFPTLRTRGGDNRVTAGALVEIPASTDSIPYFTVNSKSENYAGEELLIIISPSPIKLPFEIDRNAQTLTRDQVEKWLDDWGSFVDIYDGAGGEGIAYTTAEAEAALNVQSRKLTQEEPVPQTMYRVWTTKTNQILLVPVRMMAQKIPE
jgi:hypothetical protein